MEIMDEPSTISFNKILTYSTSTMHPKHSFIQELILTYTCFQDKIDSKYGHSKWNHTGTFHKKKASYVSTKTERPKIGIKDSSKEAILKKELQSLLNKLTHQNFDSILRQVRMIFNSEYLNIIISIVWSYLQKQPEFQSLYIQIIENFYPLMSDEAHIEMGTIWNSIWRKYLHQKEWRLSRELIELSHNYNDFCDYVKEKKRLVATAQALARMVNLGIIHGEAYDVLYDIIYHIVHELDSENKIDLMAIECYIEQAKEYYKHLSDSIKKQLPSNIENLINDLKDINVNKSCQFKIDDFIESIVKNEKGTVLKIKSIYDLGDEL